jgi:hypothetical protein
VRRGSADAGADPGTGARKGVRLVAFWLTSVARRRWRAWLALGVLVGLLTGAVVAALAIAAAGAMSWSLWRYWPVLRDDGVVPVPRWPVEVGRRAAVPPWWRGAWVTQHVKRVSEEE